MSAVKLFDIRLSFLLFELLTHLFFSFCCGFPLLFLLIQSKHGINKVTFLECRDPFHLSCFRQLFQSCKWQ